MLKQNKTSLRTKGKEQNITSNPKAKYKFSQSWGKLISYCKPNLLPVIIAVIFAIGGAVFSIISPDKISQLTNTITDGISSNINMDAITQIGFILVVYMGSSVILSYLQSFIMVTVAQKISKRMRRDICKKINKLPLKYFDTHAIGDTLSRVTNDVDKIGQTLSESIATLVSALVLLIGSAIMMFSTNAFMALSAIGASIIGFAILAVIATKSQKHFVAQQKYLGELNGHIEEAYAGHNVIKAYNAENTLNKQFNTINTNLKTSTWKSQFLSGMMMPIMGFVGNLGYVAVCIVGAVLAVNGTISFGVIVAFMVYVRLFSQPLSQIGQSLTGLQSTSAASYRVFEFLDEPEMAKEINFKSIPKNIKGEIEFKNVTFGYDENKTIINNFSAKIKAGQKVAIVGPTGAGKTTIVNLLMKFYETNSGNIFIDGISLKEMSRKAIHSLFCMVLQDTWLFDGTIKENIIYNKKDVSDENVASACEAVGIDHFIRTLPDGYNTHLSEEATLSAGQRQLITIARARIENSPMLILDEATSSVDSRAEILIQQAMDKLMQGRTSIIIAHRLSTIKNADLILVMKNGDIIESGSHNELIEQNGFYAELYNSQFDKS